MSLFQRSLNKCGKTVTFSDRTLTGGKIDYTLTFTNPISDVPALIKTISGVTLFDSVGDAFEITHQFCIEYNAALRSSRKWIDYNGRNFDIITFENCCEQDKQLKFMCVERGENSKAASRA